MQESKDARQAYTSRRDRETLARSVRFFFLLLVSVYEASRLQWSRYGGHECPPLDTWKKELQLESLHEQEEIKSQSSL